MLELSNNRVDAVHLSQDPIPIGREGMQFGTCCKSSEGSCLYMSARLGWKGKALMESLHRQDRPLNSIHDPQKPS